MRMMMMTTTTNEDEEVFWHGYSRPSTMQPSAHADCTY